MTLGDLILGNTKGLRAALCELTSAGDPRQRIRSEMVHCRTGVASASVIRHWTIFSGVSDKGVIEFPLRAWIEATYRLFMLALPKVEKGACKARLTC